MIWSFARYIFFLWDAETAHHLAMDAFSFCLKIPMVGWILRKSFFYHHPILECNLEGLHCKNPVGLAAGFDKDGKWLDVLSCLGFGHIEVGTVTPKAQDGNPKPRLFRLKKDHSIINRMGFNNGGVEALAQRLQQFKKPAGLIIGGNIGKNKNTPTERAADDYLICFRALYPYVDYFTINVSSPNTPGLRQLQEREPLDQLLSLIQEENQKHVQTKPLFLKIAPDLEDAALVDVMDVVCKNKFTGIIAGNTTISRPSFLNEQETAKEAGGLSGRALKSLAESKLAFLHTHRNDKIHLIAAGGIETGADAIKRLTSGAEWIQVYSGFIYEGPWMVRRIKKEIAKHKMIQPF